MDFSNTNDYLKEFSASYKKQLNSFCLPDKLSDSYTLCSCLKHSGDKEIYLLSDKKDALYVLKKGTNSQCTQIRQEYQLFQRLETLKDMPIPHCTDFWEDADSCFLLRTYIEGCSLSDYLEKRLYFTPQEMIDYMLDICNIVKILHTQSPPIIHRDIKPENFIIQKGTGRLYLIDLDTARQYSPDKSRDTRLMGTPSHAAPEQFGFSQSDIRTDIYALGKTMLYLLCGSTEDSALNKASIPKPFKKIVRNCISFAPEKRYSNVDQLIRSLKHYRRYLNSFKIYGKQTGIAVLLLAFGISLGYAAGSIQTKQDLENPITAAGNLDNTSLKNSDDILLNNTDTDNGSSENNGDNDKKNNTSSEKSVSEKSSMDTSLLEQSGVLECDLLQFQDMVNQIILDYYKSDPDAMVKDYEILTNALYQDKALNQVAGTDYADFNETPDRIFQTPVIRIRDSLAYRNQILKRYQGSYDNYKDAIFMNMNGYLDSQIANTECCLYLYATSSGEEAVDNYYQHALADILYNLTFSFDMADEAEDTQLD